MTPVLLDISRTISRAPYPIPTGIDRVERAYIEYFLNSERNVWFLSRIAGGYAVVDKPAMQQIFGMILGHEKWGGKDLVARIFGRKKPENLQRAESVLRRFALGTSGKKNLSVLLKKLPRGFTYLNVGHSNRHAALWQAIQKGGGGKNVAMIHDVIPLDFPEFSRPDTRGRFQTSLRMTAENCDSLIYNSCHTAERTDVWLKKWGIETNAVISLLGTAVPQQDFKHLPDQHPYFVCLGTIEPRKNHRILLDIWQNLAETQLAGTLPHLHIVGRRGWMNEAVFDILDHAPMMGKSVFEHNNLDDEGLSQLLVGARALLFPSFAEGFGYPLVEALQRKIPAICSNLPCFQEISANVPTYLDPSDKVGWENEIRAHSQTPIVESESNQFNFTSWEQHFLKIDTIL